MKKSLCGFRFKKANVVVDAIVFILIMLVIGVVVLVFNNVGDDLNADIQADDSIDANAKKYMDNTMTDYNTFWDDAFLIMLAFFWLGAIAGSFFVDSHPFWMILSIVFLIMILGAVVLLGNTYEDFISDEDYNAYVVDYPYMHWVLTHLLQTIIVISASIMISLYAKYEFVG